MLTADEIMKKYELPTEMYKRISEAAGPGAMKRSVLSIRYGAGVLDSVLGEGEFKRVLEIGTLRGISAAYMAPYVDRVITIDLVHGRLEELGVSFDRLAFWKKLEVAHKIELRLVRDQAEKARVIRDEQFDLAFIDGGKHDIAYDFGLVKRCGAVLFHDVDRRGSPDKDQVYDFVMALPKEQVTRMDIFALWRAPRG